MATIGRAGLASALCRASSSSVSSMPAQATGANLATPWVEASARWAVPKASMTKTSHSAAYFLRGLLDVLLLALVEAAVLQQHHFAGGDIEAAVDPVADHAHRLAELGCDMTSATGLREFSSENSPSVGTTEVGRDHHLGAGLEAVLDGRHGGGDAGVGGDLAVLDRHVEVGADEDALALEVEIGHA